ncbi:MAG: hypothetical protein ACKOA9_03675 [Actinomycetota bacterium]
MLPFERLRALARHSGDDRSLTDEVADCLAHFDDDPAQLVLVCRRLLAHHPANGSLWWLCARVVGAADPAAAARDAMRTVARDRTSDRLAAVLPFPHDDPVMVLGWPETAGAALAQRTDLDVVVVRPEQRDLGFRRRLGAVDGPVRMVSATEAMAVDASHLLVEARVTSPTTAVVPVGTADLRGSQPDAAFWLVAPVDRILPARLFAVVEDHLEDDDGETLDVAALDRIAGPGGLDSAERFVTRLDCPLAPELLRI